MNAARLAGNGRASARVAVLLEGLLPGEHVAVLDRDTKLDDVTAPEFWAPLARKLKPGDRIAAGRGGEDGGLWLLLHVRQVSSQRVSVHLVL